MTAFGVAAAGQRVYVAWTRHRTLVVRINDGYGRASRWSAVRRLGRFSGAGDMSMAATGSSVFVALRTGAGIVLWASRDGGSRWTKMRVAPWQCNRDDWDDPLSVAASGRLVALAWTRCEAPAQVRISRDSGRHWARVHDGAAAPGTVSLAVRHGRVALSGTTGDGSASEPVRTWWQLWQGAGWSAIQHVDLGRTSQVVLPGGNALAFAHVDQGISLGGEPQERLLWTRSADLGRSWAAPVEVAACALPRYVAGFDVARGSGGSEHILYNLYQPGADVRAFVRSSV